MKKFRFKPGERGVLKVANTEEGRTFIKNLRCLINSDNYKIRVKTRHSDRKGLFDRIRKFYSRYGENVVPIDHAEYYTVYIVNKSINESSEARKIIAELKDKLNQYSDMLNRSGYFDL